MRTPALLFFSLLYLASFEASAQTLNIPLSPLQVLKQNVGKTEMTLTYSRPSMRGRVIFGDLVPYDRRWRTGANRNSKIEFSHPVMIGDYKLEKGSYALIATPGRSSWKVHFYDDISSWEVPEPWVDSLVVAEIEVPSIKTEKPIESMKFSFDDLTYESCVLSLAWEQTEISIPIKMFTEEQMAKDIDKVLNGPRARDYTRAASYRLQTGKELAQAIEWIDMAIQKQDPPFFYDHFVKAKILVKQGKQSDAKQYLAKSKDLAETSGNNYGLELIEQFEKSLKN